ncbi:hypothetical protein Vretifemale_12867, partial [Volvox reticuliferus]
IQTKSDCKKWLICHNRLITRVAERRRTRDIGTAGANSLGLAQWCPMMQERHGLPQPRTTSHPSFPVCIRCALIRPRGIYSHSLLKISATSQLPVVAAVARQRGQSGREPYPLHLLCAEDQSPSLSCSQSSDPTPGPGPRRPTAPQPSGPGGPGGGPNGGGGGGTVSSQLRYWILLLAQYGGLYGTAAVLIAALAHIDAFGGMHWDVADVSLGLGLMIPVLVFDAVVGLPDWTTRQEDAAAVVRLFVDPELLQSGSASARAKSSEAKQQLDPVPQPREGGPDDMATTTASISLSSSGAPVAAGATQEGSAPAATANDASSACSSARMTAETDLGGGSSSVATSSTSSSDGADRGGARRPGRWWVATQRLRMAFELMQASSLRDNPAAGITVLQEVVVILVAMTADEMLYRAVLLTLFGRWLRDRAYEAGAEDILALPGGLQLDTAAAANWAALGMGLALGMAVFGFKAWREAKMSAPLMAIRAAEAQEEAEKKLRKQQLAGKYITEEQLREEREKQARLQAAQMQLANSIGFQGALLWLLEGGRDLAQMAAAGSSFLLTANLAAPLAGSVAAQLLASGYQRLALRRAVQRRIKAIESQGRAERMQQQQQQKE